MNKFFGHLKVVTKHRYLVFKNGCKMGIGFHCLFHDLSKFSPTEFNNSVKFFQGDMSPVFAERKAHGYYSFIARHHVSRNKHHWEYWVDTFRSNMVIKTMPYKYALEYVADVLSAAKTYNPKTFKNDTAYNYVKDKIDKYFMTKATKDFIMWAFLEFKNKGFDGLNKKDTFKKYNEITKKYPDIEIYKINLSEKEIIPGEHD